MQKVEKAKKVLLDDTRGLFGIFGIIETTGYFPPCSFLNEFFMEGHDPCDQDRRMESWESFLLSSSEYLELKEWWIAKHPGTEESSLDTECWDDWVQEVLELLSK